MTGFGRVTAESDGREIVLELKSVNHRFLDIGFRMPRALNFLEDFLRKGLQARLARGHVDLYLGYRNARNDAREVILDDALATAYAGAFVKMQRMTGLEDDITLSTLAAMPDVLTAREREDDREAIVAIAMEALTRALDELIAAREIEGKRLAIDVETRLCAVEAQLAIIEGRMDVAVREVQEKLTRRVEELLGGTAVDSVRIAQETAILADKGAIDEETVRLRSHIAAVRDVMAQTESAGRKLDFLVQEMHREVNTMGSKTSDMMITTAVLTLKGEIEKIREQVQNIE
jgi:uncharacterized protein (TIGR00255 family)